jgi:hypothetical protein
VSVVDAHLEFRIEELYAFVAVGDDLEEGLVAIRDRDGAWKPLVTADYDKVLELKEPARAVARRERKRIRIVKFTRREDVELIEAGD